MDGRCKLQSQALECYRVDGALWNVHALDGLRFGAFPKAIPAGSLGEPPLGDYERMKPAQQA